MRLAEGARGDVSRYRLTPEAEEDIFEIWRYIVRDNRDAADRVEAAILETCLLIARSPQAGQLRRDVTSRALRFWPVPRFPNYQIVYDPATKPVIIYRVVHGARNLKLLLNSVQ